MSTDIQNHIIMTENNRSAEITDQERDITKQDYTYISPYTNETFNIRLEALTYNHNGTLAVCMQSHTRSLEEIEEMTRMGMSWEGADEMEEYGVVTVNLDSSDMLPLNVQFVDENNLPDIGDWLEKNGIAKPTGLMARSGWCLYPAYEFNLTQQKLNEILEQRMKIDPEQTVSVLEKMEKDRLLDMQDDLDRCMTLSELKEAWLSMPEQIREQVSFPEKIAVEGKEDLTLKEWEEHRFTAPIPEGLPAYSYKEARSKLDERREDLVPDGSCRETYPTPEGELTRFGEIKKNQATHYFPTEYSNPFLVEERSDTGRLVKEYIAIDTSYSDNVKSGPCIEHINGRITVFSMYSADIDSNLCRRDARCFFSPKGTLIAVMEGDFGQPCGHIRHTEAYKKAVDSCRDSLNMGLDKVISSKESKNDSRPRIKGPGR